MFITLQKQIQDRFAELLATGNLFYIDVDKEKVWERYLSGWNDDPIEMQGHNCNHCKSFLRQYAGIVAIKDNKVMSIWDIVSDEQYALSIKRIRDYVMTYPISDIFLVPNKRLGIEKNIDGKKEGVVWHHFHLIAPSTYHRLI